MSPHDLGYKSRLNEAKQYYLHLPGDTRVEVRDVAGMFQVDSKHLHDQLLEDAIGWLVSRIEESEVEAV